MSIKKITIALAAMALSMMGLASMAHAEQGKITDITTGAAPANGYITEYEGWAKFDGNVSAECHVVAKTVAKNNPKGEGGRTGEITEFKVDGSPHTVCKTSNGCTVESVTATTPWHLTTNKTDFSVTSKVEIHNQWDGFLCPDPLLTFNAGTITLEPLETNPGADKVTNTNDKIGAANTTESGDLIAGIEISGTGEVHSFAGTSAVTATGELEVKGTNLCTWKLD